MLQSPSERAGSAREGVGFARETLESTSGVVDSPLEMVGFVRELG